MCSKCGGGPHVCFGTCPGPDEWISKPLNDHFDFGCYDPQLTTKLYNKLEIIESRLIKWKHKQYMEESKLWKVQ